MPKIVINKANKKCERSLHLKNTAHLTHISVIQFTIGINSNIN